MISRLASIIRSGVFQFLLLALTLLVFTRPTIAAADPEEKSLPPGVHPRLLFTQDQIPAIRARAQTEDGKSLVAAMVAQRDQFYLAWKNLPPGAKIDGRLQGRLESLCLLSSFIWVATGDQADADKALQIFRLWFSSGAADPNVDGWGEPPELSISYDILYPLLTDDEHHHIEQTWAALIAKLPENAKTAWWLDGPHPSGRITTNWSPIGAACGDFTNLVLEGQPGYNPQLHKDMLRIMRAFLDNGISVDGAMFEGTQYPMNYGTHFVPFYALAMRLRGVDLIQSTNLSQVPLWFTYEMLPWGGQSQGTDKSGGVYQATGYTMLMSSEFGGLADWVLMNGRGWMSSYTTNLTNADAAIIALLNGIPKRPDNLADFAQQRTTPYWEWDKSLPADILPNKLPLAHWFSTIGRVISRSGWGWRDAHFAIMSDNAYHPGHTHADNGSVTLADRGVNFIADSGAAAYTSDEHNLVLIDGKGQSPNEGSDEAYVRSADLSDYADITDIDLTMAYTRALTRGFVNNQWHPFNPVDQAGRISLFIRGATGPFVLIADDDRKDESQHPYDWLAHTELNNKISTSGRGFRIDERYGGDFVFSLGSGPQGTNPPQKGSFIAPHVDAGTYHGWLLIRGLPYPVKWSSTVVAINGKNVSSDTHFGNGNFNQGWSWQPLAQNGAKGDPNITLPEGKLSVDLTSYTGSEVALAVFTKDLNWQPSFDIPANGGDFVVMDAKSFQQGAVPWGVSTDPKGHLDGLFLGNAPISLQVSASKTTQLPYLDASQQTKEAKYLCVMAASDTTDDRALATTDDGGGQTATIRSAHGVDIIGGAVDGVQTTGDLATDAAAAAVSLVAASDFGTLRSYAMASGQNLAYRSQNLVQANQTVHVINDGSKLIVRGPGGATVSCARLAASTAVINGVESPLLTDAGATVSVQIPRLPEEWTSSVSENGRFVTLTGDGPLPVHIHAPDAIDVKVNGVSRFFTRDDNGDVWPLLQLGCGMIPSEPGLDAEALAKSLSASAKSNLIALPQSRIRALQLSGENSFQIPTLGTGLYDLSVSYAQAAPGALKISFGGKDYSTSDVTPGYDGISRAHFENILVPPGPATVTVSSDGNYAITAIGLTPDMKPILSNEWMTIGPFPPTSPKPAGDWARIALSAINPPDTVQDFSASYPGPSGVNVAWKNIADLTKRFPDSLDLEKIDGSKERAVFYAITYITSPDERDVRFGLSCDLWANVFLNGKLVPSERPPVLIDSDSAQFNGGDVIGANLHLQKGSNTLLVKVVSGPSGTGFSATINDPGDLVFQPQTFANTSP